MSVVKFENQGVERRMVAARDQGEQEGEKDRSMASRLQLGQDKKSYCVIFVAQ